MIYGCLKHHFFLLVLAARFYFSCCLQKSNVYNEKIRPAGIHKNSEHLGLFFFCCNPHAPHLNSGPTDDTHRKLLAFFFNFSTNGGLLNEYQKSKTIYIYKTTQQRLCLFFFLLLRCFGWLLARHFLKDERISCLLFFRFGPSPSLKNNSHGLELTLYVLVLLFRHSQKSRNKKLNIEKLPKI